jgi:hypothetical protein
MSSFIFFLNYSSMKFFFSNHDGDVKNLMLPCWHKKMIYGSCNGLEYLIKIYSIKNHSQ